MKKRLLSFLLIHIALLSNTGTANTLNIQRGSCSISLQFETIWDVDTENPNVVQQILDIWTTQRGQKHETIEAAIRTILCRSTCRVFTYKNNDEVVGFAAMNLERRSPLLQGTPLEKVTTYYFSLAATKPEYEGFGIYPSLAKERIKSVANSVFSNIFHVRTQNPKIYTGTVKALEELKSEGIIKGYKLRVQRILRGYYDGKLIIKEPELSNDPEAQRIFSEINPEAGDAFVFAWEIIK